MSVVVSRVPVLEALEPRRLMSANVVTDFNPPGGPSLSGAGQVAEVGGAKFFGAYVSGVGASLWRTGGTPEDTVLLKDLDVGREFVGVPWSFVAFGRNVYFLTSTALWATNGTPSGTVKVEQLGGDVSDLTVCNGALYFVEDRGGKGERLLRSNGKPSGVSVVLAPSDPAPSSQSITSLTAFGNSLVFSYHSGTGGHQVWRTDGTAAGTSRVRAVAAGEPIRFHRFGKHLYFTGDASNGAGAGLWRTDGTAAGTVRVKAFDGVALPYGPSNGVALKDRLYFSAPHAGGGVELWRTDGTEAGTALVKDLTPEPLPASTAGLRAASLSTFSSTASSSGFSVIVIDWPPAPPEPPSSDPADFHVAGGTVVFTASDGGARELWRTDGTAAGTRRISNFALGKVPFRDFAPVGDSLFFTMNDRREGRTATTLYVTDGTSTGTRRLWSAPTSPEPYDPGIEGLSRAGGSLFFTTDAGDGRELMRWDATGMMSGVVFNDVDRDGVRDDDEVGLRGWRVFWDRNGDGVRQSNERFVRTNSVGRYRFDAFPAGPYNLRVTPPGDGWEATGAGGAWNFTSPVTTGGNARVNVGAAEVDPTPGAVAGTVFVDGPVDDPARTRLAGARVFVDRDGDGAWDGDALEPSDTTDADGDYRIAGLLAGVHRVTLAMPGGRFLHLASPAARTTLVAPGSVSKNVHFLLRNVPDDGAIRGAVFQDRDADGERDAGEPGFAGLTLYLDANGDKRRSPGERTAVTDADGAFAFDGLVAGDYGLRQAGPPAGSWVATTKGSWSIGLGSSETREKSFGYRAPRAPRITGYVFHDANGDGVANDGTPSVRTGRVYSDLNGNGRRDAGDPSAALSADGTFELKDLAPGPHRLRLEAGGGFTDARPGSFDIEAVADVVHSGVVFHVRKGVSLGGTVFYDANRNNRRDEDESARADVTVYIDTDRNGLRSADEPSAVSDAQGRYVLPNLTPGERLVRAEPPTGWVSFFQRVTLEEGVSPAPVHVSVSDRTAATGRIFVDNDGSGVMSAGDAVLADAIVYADVDLDGRRDDDEPWAQSNASGYFRIVLPPGRHRLRLHVPPTDPVQGAIWADIGWIPVRGGLVFPVRAREA